MRGRKWIWAALAVVVAVVLLAFSTDRAGKRTPDLTRKPPVAEQVPGAGAPGPTTAPASAPGR